MSEASASASAHATPHDASAHVHPSLPPRSGTSLLDFPPNATFQIYRKPDDGNVEPDDGGTVHVNELTQGGDYVLVCFGSMLPSDWCVICSELERGKLLGLKPLLVAALDRTQIGCGLWRAKELAGLHGLTKTPTHPMVFVPSPTLMRLLRIDYGHRTRNALVLIRNGHVVAEWISRDDDDKQHNWTKILTLVH